LGLLYHYVREDHGDRFGRILVTTSSTGGPDGAWDELDKMLEHGAQAVRQDRGRDTGHRFKKSRAVEERKLYRQCKEKE
jgi:hypothetical protein